MGILKIDIPDEGLYLYLPDAENPTVGPLSRDQVADFFNSGVVTHSTFLWFRGLTNWIAVGDIPDFDRRKPQVVPNETPESSGEHLFMLYRRGEVVEESFETVKALVLGKELRRTDVIYDRKKGQWCRSDQHPIVKELFSSPDLPKVAYSSADPVTPPIRVISNHSPSPSRRSESRPLFLKVAHGTAVGSLLVLGILVFRYAGQFRGIEDPMSMTVTYQDVQRSIDSNGGSWEGDLSLQWNDLAMPPNVREFFVNNKKESTLLTWARQLPEKERGDFLHNLGLVLTAAESDRPESTFKALQEFRAIKMARFAQVPLLKEKSKLEKTIAGLMVLMVLGLVALYSLVLLLLAVEKNTRSRTETVTESQPAKDRKAA